MPAMAVRRALESETRGSHVRLNPALKFSLPHRPPTRPRHPKMILTAGTVRMVVPYAPKEEEVTGLVPTYTNVPRPNRLPLVIRSGEGLRVRQFDLFLGKKDHQATVNEYVIQLRALAIAPQPISIQNGPGSESLWRITEMTMRAIERQHGSNIATRIIMSITLTVASDLKLGVGPVTGGAVPKGVQTPAAGAPVQAPGVPPAPSAPRTHVVSRGETLSGISNRYYGTPVRWKQIADANGVRNANLIRVGQKLRIP